MNTSVKPTPRYVLTGLPTTPVRINTYAELLAVFQANNCAVINSDTSFTVARKGAMSVSYTDYWVSAEETVFMAPGGDCSDIFLITRRPGDKNNSHFTTISFKEGLDLTVVKGTGAWAGLCSFSLAGPATYKAELLPDIPSEAQLRMYAKADLEILPANVRVVTTV